MKVKLKTLACFSLLGLSINSFAGSLTYLVTNDARSVQNPITITQAHVEYTSTTLGCNNQQFQIFSNIQTTSTEKTPVKVDTSAVPAACWNPDSPLHFQLVIDVVDSKKPSAAPCGFFLEASSADDNVTQNPNRPLIITETADGFNCSIPPSA
ncbi:MAG TPA: hypothetical protein VHE99_10630 [Gammaproteobacteria bacterium]|nr:hypothetical protein [Gammaproteobacteria bacterium]